MPFSRCFFLLTLCASTWAQAQAQVATPEQADTLSPLLTQSFSYALTDTLAHPAAQLEPLTFHLPDSTAAQAAAPLPAPVVQAAAPGWLPKINHATAAVADQTAQLLSTAMGLIGVPYRRGGTNAATGFDCSGFVRSIYADVLGHQLPRVARDQAQATIKIEKNELRPGDLVFFNTLRRTFSHVGIYIGDGKFIHSPRSGSSVRIDNMRSSYWSKRFNGARRVPVELGSADSYQLVR